MKLYIIVMLNQKLKLIRIFIFHILHVTILKTIHMLIYVLINLFDNIIFHYCILQKND